VLADISSEVLERARALGLGDDYHRSLKTAASGADAVFFCAPVGANAAIAAEVSGVLKQGVIVSDVGSVKAAVISAIAPHLPAHAHLVPAHPVAGTEHSGPDAGFSTLFANRWCILTPSKSTCREAVDKIKLIWESFGANVEVMTPEHHDLVLAITSHVPHLISYNIVGTAADLEEVTRQEVIKFSAGGFRDFTRIASSDPTMWRDVFLNNREAVLEMLGRFTEDLTALQRMIRRGDGDGLFNLFTRTRAIRKGIVNLGQETAEPDFGRRIADKADDGPQAAGP
jgi:cyclohexadieny/prephenate dehydrogenase